MSPFEPRNAPAGDVSAALMLIDSRLRSVHAGRTAADPELPQAMQRGHVHGGEELEGPVPCDVPPSPVRSAGGWPAAQDQAGHSLRQIDVSPVSLVRATARQPGHRRHLASAGPNGITHDRRGADGLATWPTP